MEEPNVTWTKATTATAADEATCLSALLEQNGFFKANAVRWLTSKHIAKFLDAMNADEALKLMKFSSNWHFQSNPSATTGLPLLSELDTLSDGPRLIYRLAELHPAWVGRWWRWKTRPEPHHRDDALTKILIPLIDTEQVCKRADELSDEFVAQIAARSPGFLDVVSGERFRTVLLLVLNGKKPITDLIEQLSSNGIAPNGVAIVDAIITGREEQDALELLNTLMDRWKGPAGSDPITQLMESGDNRLGIIIRLPWQTCDRPSGKDTELWNDQIGWNGVGAAIATALCAAPASSLRLELGFSCGRRIAESGVEPSAAVLGAKLSKLGIHPTDELVNDVLPMAVLWATLRKLAEYEEKSWDHKTELVGLRAKTESLVAANPQLWAQSLQWILARSSKIGPTIDAITVEFSDADGAVRIALESACDSPNEHVRLKARGIRTLLLGLDKPDSALGHMLADAAARYMDGIPMFPHPLAPLAATWLGSMGVELAISSGVKRACERFAAEVREQGGDIEESLTKALVKELEVEFRNTKPRLELIGFAGTRSTAPVLSVRQRPASKAIEEPIFGCDIAWLMNGSVRGRFDAVWVDLVQVKKSTALQHQARKAARSDSWRIDAKQLDSILKWSSTSTYWMIAAAGEIMVIPAKHLAGIRRGTEKSVGAKTFTVGYNEVRSAAIPLEQYLVDLLIGQWLGTSSDDVVQFALGENTNIRPRTVIEVTISVGKNG